MSAPYIFVSLKSENVGRPYAAEHPNITYNCLVLNGAGKQVIREFTLAQLKQMVPMPALADQFNAASLVMPKEIH